MNAAIMLQGEHLLKLEAAKQTRKPSSMQIRTASQLLIPTESSDQQLILAQHEANIPTHMLVRNSLVMKNAIVNSTFDASFSAHEFASKLEQDPIQLLIITLLQDKAFEARKQGRMNHALEHCEFCPFCSRSSTPKTTKGDPAQLRSSDPPLQLLT